MILISGSLLDVQPNIDYQKTTTDLTIERDDTGFLETLFTFHLRKEDFVILKQN